MMKKFTVLILFLLLAITAGIQAQDTRWDTIPGLIISEIRLQVADLTYIELANVDDVAINLKDFKITTSENYVPIVPDGFAYLPDKVLQPGETFVIAQVNDLGDLNYSENLYLGENNGWMMRTMPEILEYVDLPVFMSESNPRDPRDSVSGYPLTILSDKLFLTIADAGRNAFLEYFKGGDSVFADIFYATALGDALTFTPQDGLNDESLTAVAGIPRVVGAVYMGASGRWPGAQIYTIVRKTTVEHGNVIWNDERGTDPDNSEWIVVPADVNQRLDYWEWSKYFTTIGRHGNGEIDATTVTSDVVTIDWVNHKMSVPWGIRRFNLMDHFTVGDNITWQFIQNENSADLVHINVCTGDKLVLYATGENRQEVEFDIETVAANDQTKALILPLLTLYTHSDGSKTWERIFEVTYDIPGMDTIYGMDFGLRVDSLYKYIEKAEGATWKLICVDGKPNRADLKRGDLLRVTNGGVTKDYYLAVSDVPIVSNISLLSAIKWPDIPDALLFSPVWNNSDIIPKFKNVVTSYIVDLPRGSAEVPALTAIAADMNATVSIEPATAINGLPEERTTTITVVSEDGTNTLVYTVRFDETKNANEIQPFTADPLFTRFLPNVGIEDAMLQISNPGTTSIDLSNYVVCNAIGGTAPDMVFARALSAHGFSPFAYIIGYDYGTETEWNAKPGIVHPDYRVNPILGPGKSIVIAGRPSGGWYWNFLAGSQYTSMFLNPYVDINWSHIYQKEQIELDRSRFFAEDMVMLRAGWDWYTPVSMARDYEFNLLYKIVGDSIKEGLKAVGSDLSDFQLIDMMGRYDNTYWEPITGLGPGRPVPGEEFFSWVFLPWSIERKPEIWKGNPLPGGSWGTEETSEWLMTNTIDQENMGVSQHFWELGYGIEKHVFTPVMDNNSTVISRRYFVRARYGASVIRNVITGTTVAEFEANLIKKHPGQTLELLHKGNGDVVVSNDTLKVTSSDGTNITRYILTVTDVGESDDAVLVAKDGSGLTVAVSGNVGTVSGVSFGITLEELLSNLIKPVNSILRIIDENGNLVPMKYTTAEGSDMTVNATENIALEVTSENDENKITYELVIAEFTDDAAFLYSNVYDVDQELQIVSLIPIGIKVQSLFTNLMANEGATVTLVDKVGTERTEGDVAVDDNVIVTSPDGTVMKVYWLSFMGERHGTDAYVTSDVLVVDQFELTITGIPKNTPLSIFVGLVNPAPYSSLRVLNAEGAPVTSGNIAEGFTLEVTSGDGFKTVEYDLSVLVTIPNTEIELVRIYPNPATDQVTIEGLRENCTVTITSILGNKVKIIDSKNIHNATISVEDLPSGIYLIQITAEDYKSQPVRLLIQ